MTVLTENLTVQRGGDTFFSYQLDTPAGEPLDLTNYQLRFVAQPLLEIILFLYDEDSTIKLLHITEALAARIGGMARPYQIILDRGDVQTPLVRGTITAEGFVR